MWQIAGVVVLGYLLSFVFAPFYSLIVGGIPLARAYTAIILAILGLVLVFAYARHEDAEDMEEQLDAVAIGLWSLAILIAPIFMHGIAWTGMPGAWYLESYRFIPSFVILVLGLVLFIWINWELWPLPRYNPVSKSKPPLGSTKS